MEKMLDYHGRWSLEWDNFLAHRNFGLTTNMTLKMLGVLYVRMRGLPCGHWVLLRGKERSERDRCPMISLKCVYRVSQQYRPTSKFNTGASLRELLHF